MKSYGVVAVAMLSLVVVSARAQTTIDAGEWEVTEKTTMEGMQPMSPTSKKVCLKTGHAQLERLLFPAPEEMKEHGCRYEEGARQSGIMRATLVCPPTDNMVGVTAKAEISYSATSYQGLGQIEALDKSGTVVKGKSELSGKRIGDC